MRRQLDVGIVGSGTAGAAAALLLARDGHRVTVYEAVDDPRPVGAGILLQPTGQAVLGVLGLLEGVAARCSRVERLYAQTARRRPVLDLAYARLEEGLCGLGLHRGVLFEALHHAVRAEPGVTLHMGSPVGAVPRRGPGRAVIGADGSVLGEHALVVVADGARSTLRHAEGVVARDTEYPWGARWFVAADPDEEFAGELYQVVRGTGRLLGFLPTGLGPRGTTPQVSVFWSTPVEAPPLDEEGLATWKDEVLALEPRAEAILDQIERPEQLLPARYRDVVLERWHAPALVFLGDAGHAMSPQLGQGANLALVDAATLAAVLRAGAPLEAFSAERAAHLGYYQWASRALTPLFQSGLEPLGWLRDFAMGPVGRLPFVERKMLRTLAGVERGILHGRPMPL